jgi:GAF domain-containing protein/HAMP domain-containing protein
MGLLRFFRNLGLGVRLIIIVILTLSILLAVTLIITYSSTQSLTVQSGRHRAKQETEVIQRRFEDVGQEILASIKVVAYRPELIEAVANRDAVQARTALLVGAAPFDFDNLYVVDVDGERLTTVTQEGNAYTVGQESDLLSFALLGIEAIDIIVKEQELELHLAAVVPMRDALGAIVGAVLASRRVDDESLKEINFSREDIHLALIGADSVLAHDFPMGQGFDALYPTLLKETNIAQVLSGQAFVASDLLEDADGIPHTLAYAPLTVYDNTRAAVGILIDLSELVNHQRRLTINLALILAFLTLLAIVAISQFAQLNVVAPINRIRSVIEQMTSGDYAQRAETTTVDEVGQLANVFNNMSAQLQRRLEDMEQHTTNLQQRLVQQQISTEVAYAAAPILDLNQLTQQVAELVRHHFDLHYVGLFLMDETGEWAVLRGGASETVQKTTPLGRRIRTGEGAIGWSIANAQPRIASDQDIMQLTTDESPPARSEVALPLRSRGQVLGALSVQSDQPLAFDQESVRMWQRMADQLAVALDNARLFTEAQEALRVAQRAYTERSRDAWTKLLRARPEWGYSYEQKSIAPAQGAWRQEMLQVVQTGQSVYGRSTEEDEAGGATLTLPLKVRDQTVGVLDFQKDKTGKSWTVAEIALLETVAEQLNVALESAQLYQDTQRRALREQITTEITARIRETLDVDTVLRTTIREIGDRLNIAKVEVRMSSEEEK